MCDSIHKVMPKITHHTFKPSPNLLIKKKIYQTPIQGLLYLDHDIYQDDRGFFAQLSIISELEQITNQPFHIKQINLAHSKSNVIRGIHAENWNKLVCVTRGAVFSAFVDLRSESSSFLQVVSLELGENHLTGCLFITQGIGNSICVTKGPVDYFYCVDQEYSKRNKAGDKALSLFDQDLNIQWPIPKDELIYSQRDKNSITLRQLFPKQFE